MPAAVKRLHNLITGRSAQCMPDSHQTSLGHILHAYSEDACVGKAAKAIIAPCTELTHEPCHSLHREEHVS